MRSAFLRFISVAATSFSRRGHSRWYYAYCGTLAASHILPREQSPVSPTIPKRCAAFLQSNGSWPREAFDSGRRSAWRRQARRIAPRAKRNGASMGAAIGDNLSHKPTGNHPCSRAWRFRRMRPLGVYVRFRDQAWTSSDLAKCTVSGGPFMSSPNHSPSVFTLTVAVAGCSGHGLWSISPRYTLPA